MRRSTQIGRPDRRRNRYPLLSIEGFFNTIRKERTFPTAWQIRQIDTKIDRKLAFGHRLRRTHVNEWRGARPPVFVLFCMARKGASLEGRGDL